MHLPWRDAVPGDGPAIMTSVTGAEAAELARLAAAAGDVLEIGSAYGYSAIVMALAGGHVTAVDPHTGGTWLGDTLAVMTGNLAAYGVADRVDICKEYSGTAMPALAADGRRFGLIFIDGDHTADAVRHDVQQALGLLRPGGVLACHDYGEDSCPGVRAALGGLFPAGPASLTGTLFVTEPAA
jgi:predicted O-methyltransferase YrrM